MNIRSSKTQCTLLFQASDQVKNDRDDSPEECIYSIENGYNSLVLGQTRAQSVIKAIVIVVLIIAHSILKNFTTCWKNL